MKTPANILIVDDDRDVLETARMFLKQEFSSVDIDEDPSKIPGYFEIKDYDVILLDMNFNKGVNDGEEGFYWLSEILKLDPQAIVILITAYGEVDLAVKAMKLGATDFVLKPWKNQKLLATIQSAIKHRQSKKEIVRLKASQQTGNEQNQLDQIIGNSPPIMRVKELISKVAGTDANVLVLGENGTGKELVARAIHSQSERKDEPFINVDMGAIAPTLFESELFGHAKGAFTDAKEDKPGRFEIADKGTIFLDEIGNLSVPLQSKLLTVLQNRAISRVGSAKQMQIDFRLVCATNMPLHDMIATKQFRQDLLYRINTVEIQIPALRERAEDIPLLANHFLQLYSKKYQKKGLTITQSVMKGLQQYQWPGNIRELQHAIERAVILCEKPAMDEVALFLTSNTNSSTANATTLDDMEKNFIIKSLNEHNGNVTQTASTLGLTRTALYRRMKKYGIQ